MVDLEPVLELASGQHSVIARAQLRTMGWSRWEIEWLFASDRWAPITARVARLVGSPRTPGQRAVAAVLDVGGDAALSHLSAGRWWGLTGCPLFPLQVATTSRSRYRTELASTHVVRRLPDRWSTVLDGVPVVRPELLALQLFAVCNFDRAERLVERLWSMRTLSGASIGAFLDDMGASGRNGITGLRQYLEPRGLGYEPSASNVETRVAQILREVGIELRRQVDSGGLIWTGRVDFRHPVFPLIVEVQSSAHHDALTDRAADQRRREQLEADGFVVVEVWDDDVWSSPWIVKQAVLEGLATARHAVRR